MSNKQDNTTNKQWVQHNRLLTKSMFAIGVLISTIFWVGFNIALDFGAVQK